MRVLPLFDDLDKSLHNICDIALKAGGVSLFAEVAKIVNGITDHKQLQDQEPEVEVIEEEKAS